MSQFELGFYPFARVWTALVSSPFVIGTPTSSELLGRIYMGHDSTNPQKYHPFSHCIVGYCATWSREYCRPLQDRHPMWPLYCLCHIFGDKASCQTLLDQGETKKLTHPIPGFHPFGSRPDPTSILFPIHKGLKLKPVVLNVRLVNFILHSKEEQNSRDFLILASSIRRTLKNPNWAMSA